jgi:hypothetical protein
VEDEDLQQELEWDVDAFVKADSDKEEHSDAESESGEKERVELDSDFESSEGSDIEVSWKCSMRVIASSNYVYHPNRTCQRSLSKLVKVSSKKLDNKLSNRQERKLKFEPNCCCWIEL